MDELQQIREKLKAVPNPVALLEGLFAFAPVGFQIYRADGHCLLTNKAFRELFGAAPPPDYNVLHDEIAKARGILGLIHRAFSGETVSIPAVWYDARELRQVHVHTGRRVAISATFFPLFDSQGAVSHVAIVFKDETAELQAREQLETTGRRSKFLAEASVTLAESLDYQRTLTKVAQLAVPTMADWCTVTIVDEQAELQRLAVVHKDPSKEKLVQEYLKGFPPDKHRVAEYSSVFRSGKSSLVEHISEEVITAAAQSPDHLRILRGLGLGSCMMVPIVGRGRIFGIFSFMRTRESLAYGPADLLPAEELAARAALAIENGFLFDSEHRAKEALEEAVRARDEFLSVASHELKTPLTSLQLQIQTLRRQVQGPSSGAIASETVLSKLAVVDRQANRLASLIDNLLDISRITASRIDLDLTEVDLSAVVKDVVSRFKDEAASVACSLEVRAPASLTGHWDQMRLEQIVTNLVSNALKYGRGQPIEIIAACSGETAMFQVVDHGIGIATEDQSRIFERFERAASRRHYAGLGLGLWIAQRITQSLGGSISVKSAPGQGSTFTVVLPREGPTVLPQAASGAT